jgi:ABC-2 type transport system permease protein
VIQGLIDVRDVIFFLSIMGLFLFANVITVDLKKGA